MSKSETFKDLDKPPTARNLLDMGQLSSELHNANHETLHRLADVLNPLAKSLSRLIEDAAVQIAELSERSVDFQTDMLATGRWVNMATEALRDELQMTIQQTKWTIDKLRNERVKIEKHWFVKIMIVTVVTALISTFLFLRFLNS